MRLLSRAFSVSQPQSLLFAIWLNLFIPFKLRSIFFCVYVLSFHHFISLNLFIILEFNAIAFYIFMWMEKKRKKEKRKIKITCKINTTFSVPLAHSLCLLLRLSHIFIFWWCRWQRMRTNYYIDVFIHANHIFAPDQNISSKYLLSLFTSTFFVVIAFVAFFLLFLLLLHLMYRTDTDNSARRSSHYVLHLKCHTLFFIFPFVFSLHPVNISPVSLANLDLCFHQVMIAWRKSNRIFWIRKKHQSIVSIWLS